MSWNPPLCPAQTVTGLGRFHTPIGCHTVFDSRKARRRETSGVASQSGSVARVRRTRFTVLAAERSSSVVIDSGAPARSSALTSAWEASQGASSAVRPVRMLTTPPGTSDVASTSDSVIAGSGRSWLDTTTAVLPVAMAGASTLTSPSSEDDCGARTPTTPVGSGTEKEKYGPATGFDAPSTVAILSAQPAYQTQRSIAVSTMDCT